MIGGSGERRTLKLVARYADMCNLFGDPPTVRHKVEVLEQHCQEVGRDPNTIVKTRLGSLMIRDTEAEAQRALQKRLEVPGVNPEWVRRGYLVGSPDRVAEGAQKLLDAGLDGLIFNMPHAEDVHAIELAGATLSRLPAVTAAR
jgi:alkanesulfonate monooxygenase SsuD/methylene tetrahydromethanopterin reductase-like flavin-dependent oxidoreductase (luciferase family)